MHEDRGADGHVAAGTSGAATGVAGAWRLEQAERERSWALASARWARSTRRVEDRCQARDALLRRLARENESWIAERLAGALSPLDPTAEDRHLTWDVSVDSTVARASARGRGPYKGDLQAESPGGVRDESADHGLGRSRGGLTTKIHLSCGQSQKPLPVVITAGQRGGSPQFQAVLDAINVARTGPGRPRTRPDRVPGGKAYGSRANRACLRRRKIACTIPEPTDRIRHRQNRAARAERLAASFCCSGSDEQAAGAEPLVAHAGRTPA